MMVGERAGEEPLAGAVGAQHRRDLRLSDREVDAVQRAELAVVDPELLGVQQAGRLGRARWTGAALRSSAGHPRKRPRDL
jgi:hypothetical protein